MKRNIKPIHPGVTLKEDFLKPYSLSANKLAKMLGIPSNRISEIIKAKRSITADTALRLEKLFGVSAQFWLNLQSHYDLELSQKKHNNKLNFIKFLDPEKFYAQ